jgi:predicted dehydrogenase
VARFSRRGFLQAGSGATLGLLASNGSSAVITGPRLQSPAEDPGSGDPVRFASIGVGIEGSSLLRTAVTMPQAKCVAACDLYDDRHLLARQIAGQDIRTTRRYHEILDDKNIEAVIVATPDHWHKQVTVDALAAGKDVYCEKPMAHTIAEGEAMVQAVQSGKNLVQVGSQRVSSALFLKAKSLFDAGAIGELLQVELQLGRNSPGGAWEYPIPPDLSPATLDWETWQGDVPKKPFNAIDFSRWRCFRAYGTGMAGDLMVHLLSGMQCITGINAMPDEAFSVGGIRRWPDGRDMPDVQTTAFLYGRVPISVRLSLVTETPEVTRVMGSHGILELTESSLRLTPQLGVDTSPDYGLNGWPAAMHAAYEKKWHAEHDPELEAHILAETRMWHGASWDDFRPHLANFFSSVRTRKSPVEDVVFGHHAAGACHMANASYFRKTIIRPGEALHEA